MSHNRNTVTIYCILNTRFVENYSLFINNPFFRMGRCSAGIRRACVLVVDTWLHCFKLNWFVSRVQKIEVSYKIRNGMLIFYFSWNKQRTVDYTLYVNYTAYSFEAMEMEFNRFITWPDKLAHTKLEISRWRTFWKSRNRIMTLYFYIFAVFTISIFCSFQNWKYCTCQHFLLMVCMTWFQLN